MRAEMGEERISSLANVAARPRLTAIDQAKGLLMVLVVLGHIVDPAGPEWANTFRALIYGFHMPVFMYLSGFVFVYVASHILKPNFGQYVYRRAKRLLGPFLVMALIIINIKLIGQKILAVNKPVGSIFDAYTSIFINTTQSPVLAIWYLYVLFVFSVFVPVFYRLARNRFWPMLVVSLAMQAWFVHSIYYGGLTDDFYFNRICWFLVFFIGGCIACKHSEAWIPLVEKTWIVFALLLIPLDYILLVTEWRYLILGFVGSVAIHGMMMSGQLKGNRVLLFLGDHALAIYLLNTLFIGLARGIVARFITPSSHMIVLYVVCTIAGLLGPIALYHGLRMSRLTRPLTTYMR